MVVNEIKSSSPEKPGDDLALELPYSGDPMPAYKVTINNQPLNHDKDTNAVIERGVLIHLGTTVHVAGENRTKVLEAMNDWNRRKVFSQVYIDTDGEVVFDWTLNVLKPGLPTECVYDAVVVGKLWKDFYPELTKATSQ